MYQPLVSIIIPVFNGSNYLKDSINSALQQTYKNIEIIVVNDGSDDKNATDSIAKSYGDKIRYYVKENGGVSSALNFGISKMRGEWFSWLSHDDLYHPGKIESQIEAIKKNKLEAKKTVVCCDYALIDLNGEKIFNLRNQKTGFFSGQKMFKNLLSGYSLNGCSLLIPTEALVKVGVFNEGYKYIQDWSCWLQISLNNYNFYLQSEKYVYSRVHPGQQTKKIASLQPLEVHHLLDNLFLQLTKASKSNVEALKMILNYSIRTNNAYHRIKYKNYLQNQDAFNNVDQIKYYIQRIKGVPTFVFKKIYRVYINSKYRN